MYILKDDEFFYYPKKDLENMFFQGTNYLKLLRKEYNYNTQNCSCSFYVFFLDTELNESFCTLYHERQTYSDEPLGFGVSENIPCFKCNTKLVDLSVFIPQPIQIGKNTKIFKTKDLNDMYFNTNDVLERIDVEFKDIHFNNTVTYTVTFFDHTDKKFYSAIYTDNLRFSEEPFGFGYSEYAVAVETDEMVMKDYVWYTF